MYRAYYYWHRPHQCQSVARRIAHLTLLGAGVLFLGPVALGLVATVVGLLAAVVATVLPFVVIGGIAYAPYLLIRRMVGDQRRPAVPAVPEARPPMPEARRVAPAPAAVSFERQAHLPAPRRRGVVARIAAEVFCGALVGGVLGVMAAGGWQSAEWLNYVGLGAGVGAVVGFVVGGPRPAPADRTAALV